MFKLSRRYIKTAFAFFIVGLLLGLYMIVSKYILGKWVSPQLITAHAHALLFGFVISLIMGVAIWMFPRPRDEMHYSPRLDGLIALGSASQVLAGLLFIYNVWSQVRPVGKQT